MKKLLIILFCFPLFGFSQSDTILTDESTGFFLSTSTSYDSLLVTSTVSFVPTDIAGCVLWLPADGSNVWQDAAKTVPCTDGDAVYTWGDLALTNDAVQSVGASQPLYVVNQLNGKPVLRFDGSLSFLENSGSTGLELYSGGSIFIVLKTLTPKANIMSMGVESGTYYGWSTAIDHWVSDYYNVFFPYGPDGFVMASSNTIIADGNGNMFEVIHDPSLGITIYNNGINTGNYAYKQIGTIAGIFKIGTSTGGIPYFYNGDIAEIIIYNSALSAPDRVTVENYLALKYNLSIEWYIIGGLLIGLCFRRKVFFNQFKQAA